MSRSWCTVARSLAARLLRACVPRHALAIGLLASIVMGSPPSQAQGSLAEARLQATRLQPGEHIVLDGSLAHPAWQRAPVHSRFFEHDPRPGAEPPQATRVQVLFDERSLYVGIDARETDMAALRDMPVRYDGVNRTQDFVKVYIDPIGTKAAAQFFRVSVAGSMADGIHTAVDDNEDFAPDFDWDAAVQRHAAGWTAVLRIPFASLRFAEHGASAASPWRVMVARRLPRQQFHWVTSVNLPRGAPSIIDRLQPLDGVRLPDDHRFLVLRPSLTLRGTRDSQAGQAAQRERHAEASLDLKWRPLAELVIDGTLKPDFSQVALDVPQLTGNSRFALFLPEKRPFFFESADLLRSPTDALYTRSITQPRGGLRATWRSSTWSGTALVADDLGGGFVLLPGPFGTDAAVQPGSRVLAARVRHEGDAWHWGGLLAARQYGHNRGANTVVGADADGPVAMGPLGDGWRLRGQWLLSQTTAQPFAGELQRATARDGQRAYARLSRNGAESETAFVFDESSHGFRHDTGFVNQVGTRSLSGFHSRKWQQVGPFNFLEAYAEWRELRDRRSGEVVEQTLRPGIWTAGARNLEWWLEAFPVARVRTQPGGPLLSQHYAATGLIVTPASWLPLVDTKLVAGRMADTVAGVVRPGAQWRLSLRLRPLRPFELEPSVSQAWLWAKPSGDRQLMYHEQASQLLAVWHVDASQHLRLILQKRGLDREAEAGVAADRGGSRTASFTYAWRRSAGTRLYLGVSQQRSDFPAVARAREVFLKLQLDADELRALW